MPKKELSFVLGGIALLVGGLIIWGIRDAKMLANTNAVVEGTSDAGIVYYYGAECPHCEKIQEFLEQNNVAAKVDYVKKEVWHDTTNNREMQTRTKEMCGLKPEDLGVPLVIGDGKCYIGEVDVQNFFKQKAGIQ